MANLETEFEEQGGALAKQCTAAIGVHDALSGRAKLSDSVEQKLQKYLRETPEGQARDFKESTAALAAFCAVPTFDNYRAFAETSFSKDQRTCKVWSLTFEQRFVRSDRNSWVVLEPPYGECGILNASRFVRPDDSELFWNYVARKIVTNKGGSMEIASCAQLDENEYTYDWKSREAYLRCDYIKLGF